MCRECEHEGAPGARAGGAREEPRPRGDAAVRGDHHRVHCGVAGAIVVERRCYVDSAVRGHQDEEIGHVECAGMWAFVVTTVTLVAARYSRV